MRTRTALAAAALLAAGALICWLATPGRLTTGLWAEDEPAASAGRGPSS